MIQYDQFIAEGIANACTTANRQVERRLDGVAARVQEDRESLLDVAHENVRLWSNMEMHDQLRVRLWELEADRLVGSPQEPMAKLVAIKCNRRFEIGGAKQVTVDFSKQRLAPSSCATFPFLQRSDASGCV